VHHRLTASDGLLVCLTRRDVEAASNESQRALRLSVIFRRVTNGFRSEWGAKIYVDLRPLYHHRPLRGPERSRRHP
jgi:transposase